ncbi:hypothetical protein COLO4_35765 [Corchorus olitorius]|uniref:Uncharacterized protein n=1 Tax=Corchorus olitorius TaxID=93759 RepID=A0A1R3GDH8_9ROSI|nr:hypothetical protein COLO4_35765 [Corchorus olitorius]
MPYIPENPSPLSSSSWTPPNSTTNRNSTSTSCSNEFGLVASSFIANNNYSNTKLFFCDIEFRESQSSMADRNTQSQGILAKLFEAKKKK